MEMTRREGMAAMLSLATTAYSGNDSTPVNSVSAAATIDSLHKLAKAKGMRFGSAVGAGHSGSGSFRNTGYASLL